MIHIETLTINSKEYKRTFSDTHTIERDGVEYDEAIDPMGSERTYTETQTPKLRFEEESATGENHLATPDETF